ncbi:MAG: hypothetical protein EBS05_09340 [Proteobacteria bacterium]|nr:hypothetical protein [Pseudomonadota bacterium]
MRRSFFILDDPFVFSWREVESKSWVSESGRIISFAHRKTLQFTASEDVEAVCYGSGREVDCVEFYLKAGTVYKLIGHDNGLIPIKELAAEESQGRAFIRIKRTTKDHRVVDYCYEIEADGRLNRTVSTFIYDEQ